MNSQRLLQLSAAALLCAGGVSCSLFEKKESGDPYATDGGYNPYNNQPGQVASTYQQYQPSQEYGQQQQQQPYQQPQYQTYTPPQDNTPEEEYKPTPAPAPKKKSKSSSSGGGGGSYTVKQGDNLYRIALSHGTTVSRLKSTNGLTSDLIRPGQHLTLP